MTRAFRSTSAVLAWLFLILIPIQFYLAGHGAMEGAHAADNSLVTMKDAFGPHFLLGTIMLLISLLTLLAALAARLPRPLLGHAAGLFVFMIVQYVLPFFNDSAGTRPIAALHAVNALIVTVIAYLLATQLRQYLPVGGSGSATESAPLSR